MDNKTKLFFVAFAAIILLLALNTYLIFENTRRAEELGDLIDEQKRMIEGVIDKVGLIEEDIDQIRGDIDGIIDEVSAIEEDIDQIRGDIDGIIEDLEILNATALAPEDYDFVIFGEEGVVKAKNGTNQIEFVSEDFSEVLNWAVKKGFNINVKSGEYDLRSNVEILNKSKVVVIGNGATLQCNGYEFVIKGTEWSFSSYNLIDGFTFVDGKVRIENSFGTTISNNVFRYCTTALELANTKTWSEATLIENCFFVNSTEASIVFKTPAGGNATGSYASSIIANCFFNLIDNTNGIVVEEDAKFNNGEVKDGRFWLSDGIGTQTGILVEGSMNGTRISGVEFESFIEKEALNRQIKRYGIELGLNVSAPTIESGTAWLGHYTSHVYNPSGNWLPGDGGLIKANCTLNAEKRADFFHGEPRRIADFEAKFTILDQTRLEPGEVVRLNFTLLFVDFSGLSKIIELNETIPSRWLSLDEKLELYPTMNLARSLQVELLDETKAEVRVDVLIGTA